MGNIKAEYIWMDGHEPTQKLRSKTKIIDGPISSVDDIPNWGFDGSSTMQAKGTDSDCMLKPVYFVADPIQRKDEWLGLKRNHPELYDKAKSIEDTVHVKGFDWNTGERKVVKKGYTWSDVGTLDVVVNLAEKREAEGKKHKSKETKRWQDIVKEQDEDDPEDKACIICSL